MSIKIPRLFTSYSHDGKQHEDWVLALATRLVNNGVNVILDQWDLNLGSDLPHFMESGLSAADRVLAICTSKYIEKANRGSGGVGYEKMILTAQLMQNVNAEFIIPLIRDNDNPYPTPIFLSSKVYIDFRDDLQYESKYGELVHELHGQKIKPRPPIGRNPFETISAPISPLISFAPERYVSPADSGTVTFDYSNNNGRYIVGAGDFAFETAWSAGGNTAIYAYTDPPSIRSVALATGVANIDEIDDASIFDTSSRVRTPHLGEIVIWRNTAGYYLATKIQRLRSRSHGSETDEITFSYVIQRNKSSSFRFDSTEV
jgi:hypothetical protein